MAATSRSRTVLCLTLHTTAPASTARAAFFSTPPAAASHRGRGLKPSSPLARIVALTYGLARSCRSSITAPIPRGPRQRASHESASGGKLRGRFVQPEDDVKGRLTGETGALETQRCGRRVLSEPRSRGAEGTFAGRSDGSKMTFPSSDSPWTYRAEQAEQALQRPAISTTSSLPHTGHVMWTLLVSLPTRRGSGYPPWPLQMRPPCADPKPPCRPV